MCVLIFSTTFVWNISHCKKKWARCDQKCLSVFMWSTNYSRQTVTKLEFPRQIFEKYSKCQALLKSVLWEPSFSMRTDGRTDIRKQLVDAPANSSLTPSTRQMNLLHTLRLYLRSILVSFSHQALGFFCLIFTHSHNCYCVVNLRKSVSYLLCLFCSHGK
jgi:hypothetical protein